MSAMTTHVRLLLATLLAVTMASGATAQTSPPSAPATPAPAVSAAQQGFMVGPALYVSDYRKSLKFYTEGLGMKVRLRFGPPDHPDMVIGFGADPSQPGIMLLTDKDGPARPIEHVHGFDRIAWRMPDIAAVAERLRAAGFVPGKVEIAHGAIQVMMVTDPDGYKLELIDTNPAPRPH